MVNISSSIGLLAFLISSLDLTQLYLWVALPKVKIYIAAPWAEKNGLASEARGALLEAGHEVTSRWLDLDDDVQNTKDTTVMRAEALNDIEDIINSNLMLLINTGRATAGRHVETGIAIAMLKPVIIIGEKTSVFHHLRCPRVDSINEAIAELTQWVPAEHKWPDVELTSGAIRK